MSVMESIYVLSLALSTYVLLVECNSIYSMRQFPARLIFGTATASYQVEGAWDVDGKSENIWDHLTHTNPCKVLDCSNGDVADNSYYLYERDVEMMRELGLDTYRFSISWTRILPTGFPDYINKAGVAYYNNLIDEMLKYNIQPIVTLYHWDLPQKIQEMGGWTNSVIVNWFGDYARVIFNFFGDRVKYFITINEPHQICEFGYGEDILAPALNIQGIADYLCMKNVLLGHARAYHIYDKEFRVKQNGKIFITINAEWHQPKTVNDEEAARDARQFYWEVYAHPIFSKSGNFPPEMIKRIADKSAAQGFLRSRLPELSSEEVKFVQGTSDFFGLNHYSTYIVYRNESAPEVHPVPSFGDDLDIIAYQLPEWKIGSSNFTKYVPWGFRSLFNYISHQYGNPPILVTENGFATNGGINDEDRVTYFRGYLNAILDAIDDGVDIRGYIAWSLMDNFEWSKGYTERFGLYEVDYYDPNRTRTPRKSAYVLKEIIRTRSIDPNYEPDMSQPLTIDDGL
ncbi:myrosinase 1-like [Danaus plexippus]|uniref:myrosinase 1-like n=1 Tax=Danaus plexippus TaxID=13037 RepID=UPI002AB1C740|nr:myrosinase 1-like [Danaus plexippus]